MADKIKVILENGHWVSKFPDCGAVYNGRREADDTYWMAKKVSQLLFATGHFEPILIKEVFNYSNERQKFAWANSQGAQAYIAFHRNAFAPNKACGYGTYTQVKATQRDSKLAKCIHDAISNVGISSDRGIIGYNFNVCTMPNMPSILDELLFIDNDNDNILYDKNKEKYAQAYVNGLCNYFGIDINKPIVPESESKPTPPQIPTENMTLIMGKSIATAEQMATYLRSRNPNIDNYYNALELAKIYLSEGEAEGIRGDIAFAQSLVETGDFKFGGDVKPEQNNYGGLGATGNGEAGNSFETAEIGIRAQIQHLKAYASTEPLRGVCVDNRFKYVTRNISPYVEWLGIQENPKHVGWAGGKGYGKAILDALDRILNTKIIPIDYRSLYEQEKQKCELLEMKLNSIKKILE